MTRKISDKAAGEEVATFLIHSVKRMEGVRNNDAPVANRHFRKLAAAAEMLAASPEGRQALEKLLDHPTLYVQVGAAEYVRRWDPGRVIPFFGRLLDADLSAIESRDERLDIRIRAGDALYMHFGIRSWNRNDLIEPLKAYGVDLAYRDHSKWQ